MMGFAGVWYGYAAAHGVRLPKTVDTGVGTVTKANMNDPAFAGLLDVTKRKLGPFTGQLICRGRRVAAAAPARLHHGGPMTDQPMPHIRPGPRLRGTAPGKSLQALLRRLPIETYVIAFTVALWVALALTTPNFLTEGNISQHDAADAGRGDHRDRRACAPSSSPASTCRWGRWSRFAASSSPRCARMASASRPPPC